MLAATSHLHAAPYRRCSGFSPLEGFMNQAEYDSVVLNMRMTVSSSAHDGSSSD
jgi:hypothetical protein